MRSVRLFCIIALALFCGLSALIAASDDSLGSFDLHRPATLLPMVTKRLCTLRSQVQQLRLGDLLDVALANLRDRIRHASPTPPSPQ